MSLKRPLGAPLSRSNVIGRARHKISYCYLEALEARVLLSNVRWMGTDGGLWSVRTNWSDDATGLAPTAVPDGATYNVTIDENSRIVVDGNYTIQSLTVKR